MKTLIKSSVFIVVALIVLALGNVQAALIDATSGGGPAIPASGSVTPASITTTPGNFTFPSDIMTGGGIQPTTLSSVVAYSPSTSTVIALTGSSVIGGASTTKDGMGIALMYSGTNNKQLGFFDTALGLASTTFIRMTIVSGVDGIDVVDVAGNPEPLELGNSKGAFMNGKMNLSNMTTVQKDALTAVVGDMVFDTTLHKACIYTAQPGGSGTGWETITSVLE